MAAVLTGAITMNAQEKKPEDVIKVNTEKYDFGKIKQNVPVSIEFVLTNMTDQPVVIENVTAGCGCTTPEVPKEPIAPNSTTKLKVAYNAAAMNHFDKEVYIKIAGVTQPKIVKITGDVLDATAYEAYAKGGKQPEAQKATEGSKVQITKPAKKVKTAAKPVKTK